MADSDSEELFNSPDNSDDEKEETAAPKKAFEAGSDDDSDEEEDEDSDSDQEETHRVQQVVGKPRPMGKRMGNHMQQQPAIKKPKPGMSNPNNFILEEAEDDDDEEDDEDDDEEDDLIDRREEENEAAREDVDDRMHKELDQKRRDVDAEEMEKYYTDKYVDRQEGGMHNIESGRQRGVHISRTEAMADKEQYLPKIQDPNIWLIKCFRDCEKEAAMLVMRKAVKMAMQGTPLQIKSIVAPDALKGGVYIEAYKEAHVMAAIEDISFLRAGMYNRKLVTRKEMPDILRVGRTNSRKEVSEGAWVRPARGEYKGDLAKVDYIDTATDQVTLILIPRIDYTKLRGFAKKDTSQKSGLNRFRKGKPPAKKRFDEELIKSIGGEIATDADFLIFENKRYRNGFLYRDFKREYVQVEGVDPQLGELEQFEDNVEDIRLQKSSDLESSIKENKLQVGDNIIVHEGELTGLEGRVLSINNDNGRITINPKHANLHEPLEFPSNEIRKHFKVGDHVRVIAGQYKDDTGVVVRVMNEPGKPIQAVVITDVSMAEMKVNTKDLKNCKEVSSGVDSVGRFSFGDLVEIDSNQVGVIVRLEKEYLHVLNQFSKVSKYKHAAISRRRRAGRAMALDSDKNALQIKEMVKVIDGQYKGREAEIKHIFRKYLFLYNRKVMENGGMFVSQAKHCQLVGGGKNVLVSSIDSGGGWMSPRLSSPSHPSQSGGASSKGSTPGQSPAMGGPRVPSFMGRGGNDPGRDKSMVNKTVRIIGGAYKGYIGIVKDATGAACRVELHASVKTINVDKNKVTIVGGNGTGKTGGHTSTYSTASKTPIATHHDGSKTPMYREEEGSSARTPMYEAGKTPNPYAEQARTPLYGAHMTPRNDGGQSAWDPNISNTPNPHRDTENNTFDSYDGTSAGGPHTPGGHMNYEASPVASPHPNAGGYPNAYTAASPFSPAAAGDLNSQNLPFSAQSPMAMGPSGGQSPVFTNSPASYQPSPLPGGHGQMNQIAPSPGGHAAPYQPINSPFAAYSPASSSSGGPGMSPGSLQPGNSQNQFQMPGEMGDWYTDGVIVEMLNSYTDDATLVGEQGAIRSVNGPAMCSVYVHSQTRVITIEGRHLKAVTPAVDDRVKVILGEDRESIGKLISIDGYDGIVKMEADRQLKILQLRYLAKCAPEEWLG